MAHVPAQIVAGDSVSWLASLPAYPATAGWSLAYRLLSPTATAINITSTPSGADHAVSLAPAGTSGWTPGRYTWAAIATRVGERVTVAQGFVDILPDLAGATNHDGRTPARKIVDDLRAGYRSLVSRGYGAVFEYEIAGRKMRYRTADEILAQINYWEIEARREEQAAGIAGPLRRGRINVRFGDA